MHHTQSSNKGGGRQQAFNPKKIFVGALPHETKNDHLRVLFQKYGSIVDAVVLFHPDGRPRGFGYVTFSQAESALGALGDKSNHLLLGEEVDAKRAVPGTNKLFVGGLHQLVVDADLRAYFMAFGEVADAYILPDQTTGRSRGFGFVSFMPGAEGAEALGRAVSQQYHWLHGKRVEVKKAKTPHQMANEASQRGKTSQVSKLRAEAPAWVPQPKSSAAAAPSSAGEAVATAAAAAAAAMGKSELLPPGLFDGPEMMMTMMMATGGPGSMGLWELPAVSPTTSSDIETLSQSEVVKRHQSSSPSSTTSGTCTPVSGTEKKDAEEAASSPSLCSSPKDSPMMLKPLLPLTPETSPASPSFDDSPKRLTFKTKMACWPDPDGSEGDARVAGPSDPCYLPSPTSKQSVAHVGAAAPTASPAFGDSPKMLTFKTAPPSFWEGVSGVDAVIGAGFEDPSRWPVSSSERSIAHLGPPPGFFTKKIASVEMAKSPMPKHAPVLLGFEKLATTKKGK